MTARSIRRAAERKAKKLARKAEGNRVGQVVNLQADCQSALVFQPASDPTEHLCFESEPASPGSVSETRLAAQTGLTGRTVLLPSEDAARYEQHVRDTFAEFQPVGPRETFLVQSLADTGWRMARIPGLETAIFAYGRIQFADLFTDHDAALRPSLIDMHTCMQYEKQLRNLQLQEGRLRRQFEKDITELRQVQQDRLAKEQPTAEPAPHHDSKIGFEFSTDPLAAEMESQLEAAINHIPSRDREGVVRAGSRV